MQAATWNDVCSIKYPLLLDRPRQWEVLIHLQIACSKNWTCDPWIICRSVMSSQLINDWGSFCTVFYWIYNHFTALCWIHNYFSVLHWIHNPYDEYSCHHGAHLFYAAFCFRAMMLCFCESTSIHQHTPRHCVLLVCTDCTLIKFHIVKLLQMDIHEWSLYCSTFSTSYMQMTNMLVLKKAWAESKYQMVHTRSNCCKRVLYWFWRSQHGDWNVWNSFFLLIIFI